MARKQTDFRTVLVDHGWGYFDGGERDFPSLFRQTPENFRLQPR